MAIIRQEDSKYTVELTGKDLKDYLYKREQETKEQERKEQKEQERKQREFERMQEIEEREFQEAHKLQEIKEAVVSRNPLTSSGRDQIYEDFETMGMGIWNSSPVTKAKEVLGWEPKIKFKELVEDMCIYGQ